MTKTMVELFSGSGIMSQAFREFGYQTFTYDINQSLNPDFSIDIMDLTPNDLANTDVIWASPDCRKFSFASGANNEFRKNNKSKLSKDAEAAIALVKHTIELCQAANQYWFIENPAHGALSQMPFMQELPMLTIAYCNYDYPYQKLTNVWGNFPPSWNPKGHCSHNGHPNIKEYGNAQLRAEIPIELCREIACMCNLDNGLQIPTLLDYWRVDNAAK